MNLWCIELFLWKLSGGPTFTPSFANNLTLIRGRVAYIGVGSSLIAHAVVSRLWPEHPILSLLLMTALLSVAVSMTLDCIDGYVATKLKCQTLSGRFLDLACDGITFMLAGLMILEYFDWPFREMVAPMAGTVGASVVVWTYRTPRPRIGTPISAKVSQGVLFCGIAALIVTVILRPEHAFTIGTMGCWAAFGAKALSTAAYLAPAWLAEIPARAWTDLAEATKEIEAAVSFRNPWRIP